MSATSITPKTRDSIFERILKDFLKGGKDYIFDKEFALGKGWDKEMKHFQYLYLDLLCNFSCSIEHYFNEKLKELVKVDCETKLSYKQQMSFFNDQYCDWLEEGNSGDFVTFLLEQLQQRIILNIT